jgi:hypothetical protein
VNQKEQHQSKRQTKLGAENICRSCTPTAVLDFDYEFREPQKLGQQFAQKRSPPIKLPLESKHRALAMR